MPFRSLLGYLLGASWRHFGTSGGSLGRPGGLLGVLSASGEPLGAVRGPLGGLSEASWGHLGAIFGPSWGHLGRSWGRLGLSLDGTSLEHSSFSLCCFNMFISWPSSLHLRLSRLMFDPSWQHLGRSWGHLGVVLGLLGATLGALGSKLGYLRPSRRHAFKL